MLQALWLPTNFLKDVFIELARRFRADIRLIAFIRGFAAYSHSYERYR